MTLLLGDCLQRLKEIPDNSVDSIVTDSPYGLSFMGKKWDYDVPDKMVWIECLRVLKPGGHLLSFGGTRTYHRLVVAIEDAGFEIRDQIQWLYGQGFPKSHNLPGGLGTALKPANEPICVARKPLEKGLTVAQNVLKWGTGAINIDGSRIGSNPGYKYPHGPGGNTFSVGQSADGTRTEPVESTQGRWPANIIFDEEAAQMLDEQSGEVKSAGKYKDIDSAKEGGNGMFAGGRITNAYAGETGGPSRFFMVIKNEEHVKEIECKTTHANNAELNSKTNLETEKEALTSSALRNAMQFLDSVNNFLSAKGAEKNAQSIKLDSVLEVARMLNRCDLQLHRCQDYTLDSKNYILIQNLVVLAENSDSIDIIQTIQSLLKLCGSVLLVTDENTNSESLKSSNGPTRFLYQAKASKSERNAGLEGMPVKTNDMHNNPSRMVGSSASKAKAEMDTSGTAGNQNHHPTVKPIKLMQYLINLVTPPNGTILDPFMGSGSTGVAAKNLGREFIGIEMNEEYFQIARKRIGA